MSKWISGFLPNKPGNYLIRYSHTISAISGGGGVYLTYFKRLDYDPSVDRWCNNRNTIVFPKQYVLQWWDEYGITENKIVRKLNFNQTPNNGKL